MENAQIGDAPDQRHLVLHLKRQYESDYPNHSYVMLARPPGGFRGLNAAAALARASFLLSSGRLLGQRDRYAEADSMRSALKSGYGQDCPVARTLDIVGERWTFLILRDLLRQGARKFQDLEASLAGIGPNTLSARLKRLEEAGIVERRFYEQHPPRAEYVLTEKGRALGPVLLALKRWGEKY